MKKALMLASVASMIDKFNMNNIKILRDMGYSVDVAANFDYGSITSQERVNEFKQELIDDNIMVHNIRIPRKIFDIKDIINSYKKVKNLADNGEYNIVHCHSPIGGVISRLAFRNARKKGTKVIYTAHGFHFFKGAPLKNWLIYFPLEWFCSFFTDTLITINKEDYEFARKYMKSKNIAYTHGIGVDTTRFCNTECDKYLKRKEIGVPEDAVMILSVGELSKRKNQEIIIKAMQKLNNKNVHYCLVGFGQKEEHLQRLTDKFKLNDTVHFLGYRGDISEICNSADIFCFPSLQEGLPVALMEAMATGLPVVCSKIRGNVDLVEYEKGGYLVKADDAVGFANYIELLAGNTERREQMSSYNSEKIKRFDIDVVNDEMMRIYEDFINETSEDKYNYSGV